MADFTGTEERAWIMTQLKTLLSGRAWKTAVPDSFELPKYDDGSVRPYLIVRFANPQASMQGRNIASGEDGQPHLMTFTVIAISGDADDSDDSLVEASRLLVGKRPSATAGEIRSGGGFAYPHTETGSGASRFEAAGFFRVMLNI